MNDFSHLKNKLLAEQIEDQIYHYILDTPIEPGAKLPNEFELGDMCDGIAQGHDGINYSLPHRDAIVNLVEAQANAIFRAASVLIDDFRCDND